MTDLHVTKRDGRKELVCLNKIQSRIANLCQGLNMNFIDTHAVSEKVIAGLFPGVSSVQIEDLIAEIAASMTVKHPDYSTLAARVAVTKLYKQTEEKFSNVIEKLYSMDGAKEKFTTESAISDQFYALVKQNANRLDAVIKNERDFDFNYFGYKTLEKSYLLQIDGKIVERPQHMLMRVALGIHGEDLDAVEETYELLSERWFTHASPTLFNAGTTKCQLSSCFLLEMKEDSIEGIYDTLKQCASISKSSGGIGLSVHNIRARGTRIAGTNGTSDGLMPMLRVFNNTARHVNQGGRRPGSFAIYLEPWHADIFDFIDMKKNTGAEEVRARDLFYALWIPDLFMRRVEQDLDWSLMCPHECPGLHTSYGDKFEQLYLKYEADGKFKRQVKARQLWFHIVNCQIETGTPYMMYKDACNSKSNQQNLGTIKSSNLCTEIVQYTSKDEIAVCNLASIALNRFVDTSTQTFDFNKLRQVAKVVTRNLNKIIDINHYPLEEARNSNIRHRPIGIGVQGLADAFILMRYPFDSAEARQLNKDIFENIYYAACEASCELSEIYGPYSTFAGSPASKGLLQFDLWKLDSKDLCLADRWPALKRRIIAKGMRNSLLIAPMPTATTAQILGNNESTEPFTSNMYVRRVLSGEFQVVNHHLLRDLTSRKLWNEQMRLRLLRDYGSVQHIAEIPDDLKALYRTVWEIPQKSIVLMAAERGPFIDQSQSMNIHIAKPSASAITSMHFYGWKAGLKTGTYYLRTQPAANPIQVTIDKSKLKVQKSTATTMTTTRDDNSSSSSGDERSTPEDDGLGSSENSSHDGEAAKMCSLANGPNCEMCSG